MGVKLSCLYLQQSWLPCNDDEAVRGCTLNSRVLLPDPKLRQALVLYTSRSKDGLAAVKLHQIQSDLLQLQVRKPDTPACSILYLLSPSEPLRSDQDQKGNDDDVSEGESGDNSGSTADPRIAKSTSLEMLRCLAYTAPMLQLVPTAIWSLVAALAEGQHLPDAASHEFLRQHSAVLHRFLAVQLL
jgi:hypothetical protein